MSLNNDIRYSIVHSKQSRLNFGLTSGKKGRVNVGGSQKKEQETYTSNGNRPSTNNSEVPVNIRGELQSADNNRAQRYRSTQIKQPNANPHIILRESLIFPSIYYAQTTIKSLLKDLVIPIDLKHLDVQDPKTPLIFQIVQKIFSEIQIFMFNIVITMKIENNNFYVYFYDCKFIPYSKCCNAPLYIELDEKGRGQIICNHN